MIAQPNGARANASEPMRAGRSFDDRLDVTGLELGNDGVRQAFTRTRASTGTRCITSGAGSCLACHLGPGPRM